MKEASCFRHKMTRPNNILLGISRAYQQQQQQYCNYNSGNANHHQHTRLSIDSAYQVLGLEPGASVDNVKAAYRRLALQCHPDLHTKDGAEFLRVSAAYQRILNKKTISYDVPQGPQRHYYRPDIRAYPGAARFNQTAVTVWGLGLAMGCVLFGAILLWGRAEMTRASMKGPSRMIEPSSNALKRERIAALLLERSKEHPKDHSGN